MTGLTLHHDLSYCTIDGHLVFLDIQADRYFRLTGSLESALVSHFSGGNVPDDSIRALIARKVLVEGSTASDGALPPSITIPTRSATEEAFHAKRTSLGEILDALAIVCSTQLQLKTLGLKNVLDGLASLRKKRTSQPSPAAHSESQVLVVAATFRCARLYVPIDTCCLLDSIAMVRFLAKRGLRADLVFGVTADPFSAHCWAQYGNTVLNDALGHALAHTPIRVI